MDSNQQDQHNIASTEIKGRPVSGRIWKQPGQKASAKICVPSTVKSSWEEKVKERQQRQAMKEKERQIKEEAQKQKDEAKQKIIEKRKRKRENEIKVASQQLIKNPKTIKKLQKRAKLKVMKIPNAQK
mmetsp:Transcript_29674/g.41774  ORF Transcript_29674/g.41774 Transcript_29674/m.41774 type:complete len:128 (+) Transcript_29674:18-401(+)